MKIETLKSIILTILVLLSIFLTWNLWTYQPNYATMENNNYVAQVTLSEQQEVKKIVKPDLVIYHKNGEHFGTENAGEIDKLMKELSSWSFYDIKNDTANAGNINYFANQNGNAEIIFPDKIPVELYRNVLKFVDRKIPSFNFDQIVIRVENQDRDNGIVYFISTADRQVYISHVSAASISNFSRNFFQTADQYPRYYAHVLAGKRTLFLPANPTTMTQYKYLPITLNSEDFKDALFNDPSFVQKTLISNGEEYTNGSSKMNINYTNDTLLYVNPTAEGTYTESTNDLLTKSIDFVNEHGGWTDSYRYVAMDENQHHITFRLYSEDGYPVFNEDGISEISEFWGKNEITKYVRPDLSLELPLTTESQKVTIPSGQAALNYIENSEYFKPELLQKVVLGYEMKRDETQPKLIILEPMWFYEYDNQWNQIPADELGGAS